MYTVDNTCLPYSIPFLYPLRSFSLLRLLHHVAWFTNLVSHYVSSLLLLKSKQCSVCSGLGIYDVRDHPNAHCMRVGLSLPTSWISPLTHSQFSLFLSVLAYPVIVLSMPAYRSLHGCLLFSLILYVLSVPTLWPYSVFTLSYHFLIAR